MKIGNFQITLRRVIILIVLLILLGLVMDFNTRMEQLARLENQAATVRAQTTAIIVTQHALETQVAYATSPAAVEKWAREQGRMAQPGDKLVIPLAMPGAQPSPTPTPPPKFANLTKWDVWMELIFGK